MICDLWIIQHKAKNQLLVQISTLYELLAESIISIKEVCLLAKPSLKPVQCAYLLAVVEILQLVFDFDFLLFKASNSIIFLINT